MKPLDILIRDVVAPLMGERGYKRSGRSFRFDTDSWNGAFVGFQESRLGRHDLEFYVNMTVDFAARREWMFGYEDDHKKANELDGLWRTRLAVPGKLWMQEVHLWEFNPEDMAAVDLFRTTLSAALDRLEYLTVPSNMVQALRRHELPIAEIELPSEQHAVALLLSEEGPSAELEEVLAKLEADHGRDEFVTWVRQRIATPTRD